MDIQSIEQFDDHAQQTTDVIWVEIVLEENSEEPETSSQEEVIPNLELDTLGPRQIEYLPQQDIPESWKDAVSGLPPNAKVQMMILLAGGPAAAALMAFGILSGILLVPGANAVAVTLAIGATTFIVLLGLALVIREIRRR